MVIWVVEEHVVGGRSARLDVGLVEATMPNMGFRVRVQGRAIAW